MLQRIIAGVVQSLKTPSTTVSIGKWRLDNKILIGLFWAGLIIIAIGLRLPNLGTLGLWGDEGYTVLATVSIIDLGYPALPSGGLYLRSLPFLYLEALSGKVLGLSEFSLRLPSVIIGVASIGMSYLLAKRLFGSTVACVAAVMMVFSNWEIEFSRYGRMYSLFQLLYLASVYVFYRGCIEGHRIYKLLIGPVWLLTFFVHELGVVLTAILAMFFGLKAQPHKAGWMLLAGSVVIGLAAALYGNLLWVLRFPDGVPGELLSVFMEGIKGVIAIPPIDIALSVAGGNSILLFGLAVVSFIAPVVMLQPTLNTSEWRSRYLWLVAVLLASAFHQIGLAAVFLGLYPFFIRGIAPWREKPFVIGCCVVVAAGLGWLLYGLVQGFTLKHVLRLLLEYPYVYERVIRFLAFGWPVEAALCGVGVLLLWRSVVRRGDSRALLAFASLIGPVLLVGMIEKGDDAARYSFHLFPVVLMLVALTVVYACRSLLGRSNAPMAVTICLIMLGVTPTDLQLSYAVSIAQRFYTDEITKPLRTPGSGIGYRFHPDYKTTSEFIKNNRRDTDLVISMLDVIPFYYLDGRMDYLWTPKDDDRVSHGSGTGVVRKINYRELKELLGANTGRRIWLLEDPVATGKLTSNKEIKLFLEDLDECALYTGQDDRTSVYLLSSIKEGQPVCSRPVPRSVVVNKGYAS